MKPINLKLKSWGCYSISKMGVTFYMENGFKLFVPKKIMLKLEGMVI